jgi:hypothetical protein
LPRVEREEGVSRSVDLHRRDPEPSARRTSVSADQPSPSATSHGADVSSGTTAATTVTAPSLWRAGLPSAATEGQKSARAVRSTSTQASARSGAASAPSRDPLACLYGRRK